MTKIATEVPSVNDYFEAPNPPLEPFGSRSTNTKLQPKPVAQIAYFSIEWHQLGFPDELVTLPCCSTCGLVISDLSMGVAVADFPAEQPFEPAGEIDGRPLRKVPGSLYYFHKGACDTVHGIYNIELDTIFKSDQRHDSQAQEENDNV